MSAITLKDVSKVYQVYESPLRALLRIAVPKIVTPREVWALKDINLRIGQGECVGIIGNNGSGKSTLLAVAGEIISPTSGSVAVQGRQSTLLDLTMGMQTELSGHDNVRLLAGLLGLSGEEVQSRTPMMVDFAELDDAISLPVKTYSTGMAMRLGFSVALHVDFDILIVDEVLAVGDTNFHRKCIRRLRYLHRKQHKTIIIASHGLGEIASLADRLVLLEQGQIFKQGETEEVLKAYWEECERQRNQVGHRVSLLKPIKAYGDDRGDVKILKVRFLNHHKEETEEFRTGDPLLIEIWFDAVCPVENPLFRVQIFRNDGIWVHGMNSARHDCRIGTVKGRGCMRLNYKKINLLEADYYVSVGIWPDEYTSFITDVAFDAHEKAYVIKVRSERSQGAGIVTQAARWKYSAPGAPQTQEALAALELALEQTPP